ncbi:DUF2785 domain-containing protein [Rossellomorea sp. NPDC077527]|uniref:DUF2785 domain-containing protein n=1 Tax=Rossellomorea sp. NPDC077527 TaxID=3364510 RepID=UPI0037C96760
MITEAQLKESLTGIDFTQPEYIKELNLDALLKEMIHNIGSTDGELRDKLIYTSFYRMMEGNHLSPEQMLFLFDTCMDEHHLFCGIGMKEDDSVFTRAFSSLVLALLLDKDRTTSFMPVEKVTSAFEACFDYLEREADTRGYVEGKGWAHSIAHGADYLVEVIKHPAFPKEFYKRSLRVIETCLFKDVTYIDEEEGRLFYAIESLLDKGMAEEDLYLWLTGLSSTVNRLYEEEGYSIPFFRKKMTIEQFYKTSYFRLKWKAEGSKSMDHIDAVLKKWHRHDYS